jgi:hypothetical protein
MMKIFENRKPYIFEEVKRKIDWWASCNGDNELTQKGAIMAMQQGKKVRHESFRSGEYIYMVGNDIHGQSGNVITPFWAERLGASWQKGWKVIP